LFNGWSFTARLNKYHFTPETVGQSGIRIHTDPGFLSILQEDENVGGLEVMEKNSGEYLAVDPIPGTLLVNLGDIATVWSNGKFHNVKHRVQCKEATIRVSIAMFVLGRKEEEIVAPSELVKYSNRPRLYVPLKFEDYQKLRFSTVLIAGETLDLPVLRTIEEHMLTN